MIRMRMRVFVWVCALAVSIPLAACQKVQPASKDGVTEEFPPGKAPKISCAEPSFNFGEREEAETLDHQFVIQNTGNFPLTISKVTSSCGCTAVKAEKSHVQPGESTIISASWKLEARLGKQTKTILVFSNAPEHKKQGYQLTIAAEVVSDIVLEPLVHRLGKIAWDSYIDKTFELKTQKEGVSFNLLGVAVEVINPGRAKRNAEELVSVEQEEVVPNKHYRFRVVSSGELPLGTLSLRLTAKTDSKKEKYYATLTGTVIGPLIITPSRIAVVKRQSPGKESKYRISLSPGIVHKFKVLEAIPPLEEIKVDIVETEDSNYFILLANVPTDERIQGRELIIKTNAFRAEEIRIPFDCTSSSQ